MGDIIADRWGVVDIVAPVWGMVDNVAPVWGKVDIVAPVWGFFINMTNPPTRDVKDVYSSIANSALSP